MDHPSRRQALTAIGATIGVGLLHRELRAEEKGFSVEEIKKELALTMQSESTKKSSSLRVFTPRVIEQDGWNVYTCSAHGWNRIEKPWSNMEVYASHIDWHGIAGNEDLHYTSLGGQFDVDALKIGSQTQMTFITSEDENKPMRVFGAYFNQWDHLWCLTNDSFTNDNVGGWVLHTRKTV